jgi:caffeoyl-CoA O-methyltransferase
MFHNMPEAMIDLMRLMEAQDARDRVDGTPLDRRLRQIPPETGRFLAITLAGAPRGAVLEVGASGGYSGMWLALACRVRGDRLTTFEILPGKVKLARANYQQAGVADWVEIIEGDARAYLGGTRQVAFCFMDAEKDLYQPCYDLVVPNLVPGGLFLADNVISHADELTEFVQVVQQDDRVDAVVVPIGKGVLLCRKVG